jgi:hypothetical protein
MPLHLRDRATVFVAAEILPEEREMRNAKWEIRNAKCEMRDAEMRKGEDG